MNPKSVLVHCCCLSATPRSILGWPLLAASSAPWPHRLPLKANLYKTTVKMYLPPEGKSCRKRLVPPLVFLGSVIFFCLTSSKNSSTFSHLSKSFSERNWTSVTIFAYCRCCWRSSGRTSGRAPPFLGKLVNFLVDPSFSKLANDIKMFVSSLLPMVWAPEGWGIIDSWAVTKFQTEFLPSLGRGVPCQKCTGWSSRDHFQLGFPCRINTILIASKKLFFGTLCQYLPH